MGGLTIFGICLIVVAVISVIYGATLSPVNLMNSDFMSWVVIGVLLLTVGVCLIAGMPAIVKTVAIWLSALVLCLYVYGFEMELLMKLISFVPIIGLAVWITIKFLGK
ncbi:MAG: hypothetical protein LBM95_01530 [Lactobacillales bacterium]|jgi:hypothetical protein|nr:hypothetical protein [Lactobacillales bacterium]